MKKRFIILSIIIISSIIVGAYFDRMKVSGLYCGEVKYKTDQAYSRYKSTAINVDRYLGVKFDNGSYQSIHVNIHTFMTKNIGDRVCFEMSNTDFDEKLNDKVRAGTFLSMFIFVSSSIILFVLGIIHLDK